MARSLIHPLMAVVLSPAPSLHLLPQRPPSFQRIRWRGTDVCYLSATFTHLAWSPAFNGYYSIKDLGTPSFNYRDGRDPRCVCVRACVRACLFMHVCMCLCACACVCVRACAAIILHVRKTCSLMDAVRLICLFFCFVLCWKNHVATSGGPRGLSPLGIQSKRACSSLSRQNPRLVQACMCAWVVFEAVFLLAPPTPQVCFLMVVTDGCCAVSHLHCPCSWQQCWEGLPGSWFHLGSCTLCKST